MQISIFDMYIPCEASSGTLLHQNRKLFSRFFLQNRLFCLCRLPAVHIDCLKSVLYFFLALLQLVRIFIRVMLCRPLLLVPFLKFFTDELSVHRFATSAYPLLCPTSIIHSININFMKSIVKNKFHKC